MNKIVRLLVSCLLVLTVTASIAYAAATVTVKRHTVMGDTRVTFGYIALDSSYPTGGEAITLNHMGLKTLDHIEVGPRMGYLFDYTYDRNLLVVFYQALGDSAAMTQVAAATSLATVDSIPFIAFGK